MHGSNELLAMQSLITASCSADVHQSLAVMGILCKCVIERAERCALGQQAGR